MNVDEFEAAIDAGGGRLQLNMYLASGGDVNLRLDGPQPTFLDIAIESGNIQMIEALVAAGAAIQGASDVKWTPLHHAVELDLDTAGQTAGPNDGDFLRALTFANTIALVRLGADLDAISTDNRTARDLAAACGPAVLERFDALVDEARKDREPLRC